MAMDSTKTKESGRLGITPTQVIASALAAVTAAFLGSTLGVAGTVIGAGVASLVSTVGSALYQHSLDRTGSTLRSKVNALRVSDEPAAAAARADSGSSAASGSGSARVSGGTLAGFAGVLEPGFAGDNAPTRQLRPPAAKRRRPRWRVLAGLTVIAFVLGMGVVTAVELLHGGPISGGNAGTTVGSLFGGSTQRNTQPAATATPVTTTAPAATTTAAPTTIAPTTTAPTTTSGPTTTVEPGVRNVTTTPSASATTTTDRTPTPVASTAPTAAP
jgi:hypothetical protein